MADNTYDQMLDYHAFQAQLPELLQTDKGRVAVFHDRKLVKICDTVDLATGYGFTEYGEERFIVQKIEEVDPKPVSYSLVI